MENLPCIATVMENIEGKMEKSVVIEWTKVESHDVWEKLDKNEDYGLYQILGYHPVFGNNSLLYIGMARDQDFKTRFGQHENWLKKEWDENVYVGEIKSIDEKTNADYHGNEWRPVVKDAEALFIYFHSPPYNSQKISEIPKPSNNLRIINVGDCGELYPEISHKGLALYG